MPGAPEGSRLKLRDEKKKKKSSLNARALCLSKRWNRQAGKDCLWILGVVAFLQQQPLRRLFDTGAVSGCE